MGLTAAVTQSVIRELLVLVFLWCDEMGSRLFCVTPRELLEAKPSVPGSPSHFCRHVSSLFLEMN